MSHPAEPKLIVSVTHGEAVCERAVVADRAGRRMKGLIGRRVLPRGEGLLLRPAAAIHTGLMSFPIDAVFLDGDLRVLRVAEHVRPWRVALQRGARAVLELPAGECARRGVAVGDRLGVLTLAPALTRGGARASQRDEGQVRLHPMRVVLIGRDPHFRAAASALLVRRGCAVVASERPSRVVDLVVEKRADVVVIDAGASLTAAARTVATVEALVPRVGVVVVADDAERSLKNLPVLDKWGPFEILVAAIERAYGHTGAVT
ncbi:MAG: uncharacterized protein QOD76_59 [Solirubrobacteraceae bacterium]|nr:uncharacterized protein [Solirubrobacteraceae bacterium]